MEIKVISPKILSHLALSFFEGNRIERGKARMCTPFLIKRLAFKRRFTLYTLPSGVRLCIYKKKLGFINRFKECRRELKELGASPLSVFAK